MKKRMLSVLLVGALVLGVCGTSEAIDVKLGPLLFKTYNWEVSTLYVGGTPGIMYFRNADATAFKKDGTLLEYDSSNPSHGTSRITGSGMGC